MDSALEGGVRFCCVVAELVAPTRRGCQEDHGSKLGSPESWVEGGVSGGGRGGRNGGKRRRYGGRERKGRGGLVVGRVLVPFIVCNMGQKVK